MAIRPKILLRSLDAGRTVGYLNNTQLLGAASQVVNAASVFTCPNKLDLTGYDACVVMATLTGAGGGSIVIGFNMVDPDTGLELLITGTPINFALFSFADAVAGATQTGARWPADGSGGIGPVGIHTMVFQNLSAHAITLSGVRMWLMEY